MFFQRPATRSEGEEWERDEEACSLLLPLPPPSPPLSMEREGPGAREVAPSPNKGALQGAREVVASPNRGALRGAREVVARGAPQDMFQEVRDCVVRPSP